MPIKRKVFLHLGPPKTGSTAIQSYLRKASIEGLLADVEYPVSDKKLTYEQIESGNGSGLGELLRSNIETTAFDNQLEITLDKIFQPLSTNHLPVIISNEGLWWVEEARIRKFVNELKHRGYSPEIVVVARPYDDIWQSQLSQSFRRGVVDNLDAAMTSEGFLANAKNWLQMNIPVHIVDYDPKNLISNFFFELGLAVPQMPNFIQAKVNEKLTRSEAVILRKFINSVTDIELVNSFAVEMRIQYQKSFGIPSPDRENELLEIVRSEVAIPEDMQPKYALTIIEEQALSFKGTPIERFIEKLNQNSTSPKHLTFENTPSLAVLWEHPYLIEIEQDILVATVLSIFQKKLRHYENLETLRRKGVGVTSLVLGADDKFTFKPNSQLRRSRVGFDARDYLILNPDVDFSGTNPNQHFETFGRNEGRYSKIVLKPRVVNEVFESKPLLFIHVPRTGGTTFREMLSEHFGEKAIYRSHYDVALEGAGSYSEYESLLEIEEISEKSRIYIGHFPAVLSKELKFDHSTAIFLREPLARSVSLLKKESKDRKVPISELLKDERFLLKHIYNNQTRILGMPLQRWDDLQSYEIDEDFYLLAVEQLKCFDYVGISEKYAYSTEQFDALFGTALSSNNGNVNKSHSAELPLSELSKLNDLLEYDFRLYQEALTIFNSQAERLRSV